MMRRIGMVSPAGFRYGAAVLKWFMADSRALPGRILPVLAAVLIAAIVGMRLNISANNDVFLQLLASEGVLRGQGYGFETAEKNFYSIGSRPAATRWPPGVTLLATGLRLFTADPLVLLAGVQVLLAGIIFYLLYLALLRQLNDRIASLAVTGASLSTTAYFDWHTEVASEPLFMSALAILLLQLSFFGIQRRFKNLLCVWTMEMVRTAGAYISVGYGIVLFLAERRQEPAKAFLKAALWVVVLLAPLIVFHEYYGINARKTNGIDVSFADQFQRQVFWQHQIVLPHTDWMKRHLSVGTCFGAGCLLLLAYGVWRTSRSRSARQFLPLAFVVLGFCYSAALSLSSVLAKYDWGVVYRVSAVSVVLLSFGWWSTMFMLSPPGRYRRALLGAAFAVAALKTGWYVSRARSVAVQRDYRISVSAFEEFAGKTTKQSILLCADTMADRNYGRGVLYAARTWWKPPVRIVSAEFQEVGRTSECARFAKEIGQWQWARGSERAPTISADPSPKGHLDD